MKRSSIFSSDTLEAVPRPSSAGLMGLVCLVLFGVLLRFEGGRDTPMLESHLGQLYAQNEARYRGSDGGSPRLLVVGSSRLGALPVDRLAENLGYAPDEAANYSLAGNTFWRTLLFFRRNPTILDNAEIVVLDLLPFQLFEGPLNPDDDELFLMMSTVDECMMLRSNGGRARALADMVVPMWSRRQRVFTWRQSLSLAGLEGAPRREALQAAFLEARHRQRMMEAANPNGNRPEAMVYAPNAGVAPVQAYALRQLSESMPQGCTLVLAWLPVRSDLAKPFAAGNHTGFNAFRSFIDSVDLPNVRIVWEAGDGLFSPDDFADVVHYKQSGIEKATDLLAKRIGSLGETPPKGHVADSAAARGPVSTRRTR